MTKQRGVIRWAKTRVAYFSGTRTRRRSHLMLGTEAELKTLSNSEDVHEKRFANRARLRFGWRSRVVRDEGSRRQRRRPRRALRSGGPTGAWRWRFWRRTAASSAAARDRR